MPFESKEGKAMEGRIEKMSDPEIVVEVGAEVETMLPKKFPLALKDEQGRRMAYIPVNIDADEVARLKNESEGELAIEGNIAKLPFPDGSVHSVWVNNVLGAVDFLVLEEGSESRAHIVAQKIITECARVLAPGGRLIIGETYSPRAHVATEARTMKETRVWRAGLRLTEKFRGEDVINFIERYGGHVPDTLMTRYASQRRKDKPFFVVFEKQ